MIKRIESILFGVCVVMLFTAQTNGPDNQKWKPGPAGRPISAPVTHNVQSNRSAGVRQEAPQQKEASRPSEAPAQRETSEKKVRTVQNDDRRPGGQDHIQIVPQERSHTRVYAVAQSAPVENNNLFNRQHHNHWQPRYNFYDDQYHFYPYVNIATLVELSGGYFVNGPDGQNYYYDQGTFYLQDQGGQYVAVVPPLWIIVNPIAPQARQIEVNGQIYYRYKGVFYVQVAQGYQVIAPLQDSDDPST